MPCSAGVAAWWLLPRSTWVVAAAGLLDRWARTGTQIELCDPSSKGTSRMRLSDGTSWVLVDIRRVPNSARNTAFRVTSFYPTRPTGARSLLTAPLLAALGANNARQPRLSERWVEVGLKVRAFHRVDDPPVAEGAA